MARIVYGCCGEGQGHSSRTLTMTRALQALGHEVLVLAARKAYTVLHPQLPNVHEVPGLFLVYHNNQVQLLPTLRGNLPLALNRRAIARKILPWLEEFRPDLAITDFEPFLPIAARMAGVPYISLDHQHVIPHLRMQVPFALRGEFATTKWIVRMCHSGERANLVTSFFHAEKTPAATRCLPPILREEVLRQTPRNDGHVVVYQTSASFGNLPELLQKLPFDFRIYAFDRAGTEGRLTFRPRAAKTFLEDVATADWVLSNGGYTLLSECLHLGKPVLSVPIDRQFEQWINAHHLEQMGFGMMTTTRQFGSAILEKFLARKEEYRAKLTRHNFNGNDAALAAILEHLPGNGRAHVNGATGLREEKRPRGGTVAFADD